MGSDLPRDLTLHGLSGLDDAERENGRTAEVTDGNQRINGTNQRERINGDIPRFWNESTGTFLERINGDIPNESTGTFLDFAGIWAIWG